MRAVTLFFVSLCAAACHGDAVGEPGGVDAGDTATSNDTNDTAASDVPADTSALDGDASDPRSGTIACGLPATDCPVGAQVCCGFGGPGSYSWSCKDTGTCGAGLAITCDGASDCATGEVCCASIPAGTFTATFCAKPELCCPGTCPSGSGHAFLCDPGGTECGLIGRTCKPSDNLGASFYVCQF